MSDLAFAILSAVLTIFGALIIFLLKDAVENLFIFPKRNFKKSLAKTKASLLFYKNILTNEFKRSEINDAFFEKILQCQKELRENWAEISVTYPLVQKIPVISREPSDDQIKKIQENLLSLSNSTLVYLEETTSNSKLDGCESRRKKVDEILSIINRCL
ncbi:MAG: hypothetical protein V1676_03635 [Candidatus Diapherotrites archaeon]